MELRFIEAKAGKTHARRLPCVVGRGDDADFRIRNDSVSRRHCEFTLADGVVRVTDLGSTNGTMIARKRLEANVATPVSSGSSVRIGGIVLRVEYAVATASSGESRDSDTVPMAAADLPELEPVAEPVLELEPAGESLPELEPLAADSPRAEAAGEVAPSKATPAFADLDMPAPPDETPAFPDVEPAAPPPAASFDFLGAEAAPPPPAADDDLDDFFKSLS